MDYRALGELVWFALLGLSALVAVTGLSIRLFVAPAVKEILDRLGTRRDEEQRRLEAQVERVETRLADVETGLHRLEAAEDFHRRLGSGEQGGTSGTDRR